MKVSTQTDPDVCGYVIDPLQPNLDEVPVPLLCKLVTEAASLQREHIIKDISNIGGMYKHPEVLVNTDPNKYFSNRNAVCQSFVNGLGEKASIASKVMTLEQLYHLVSPAVVAPFSFSRNLLSYAITNSKLVVNMLGKVSAGGMSYLQNIASKPLPFPAGDCEVAIDNDQKLKKTVVCQFPRKADLQRCHQCLSGTARREDGAAGETRLGSSVLGKCQANLKQAEEVASRRVMFGTMLLQPVEKYSYRPKEREVQIIVQNDKTTTFKEDTTVITTDEYADIPSFHPVTPPPITMSDPVFVNPNSAAAMKKIKLCTVQNAKSRLTTPPCSGTMSPRSTRMKTSPPAESLFDWVILRVDKLHLEMNALKAYVDLNWNVWFSSLAEEMGFKSEGAQRVAKNCADHHKAMQMLEIGIKGCTDEMVLPYVREKLEKGETETITADDFLYTWLPKIRNSSSYSSKSIFMGWQSKTFGSVQDATIQGMCRQGWKCFLPFSVGETIPNTKPSTCWSPWTEQRTPMIYGSSWRRQSPSVAGANL
ncbi:uncharacterized protein [Branchiostoma lanceolatum]|uniref:uncharacterized protein n=1 Tax=Branchiostoma lanceolatum TaxID=7740 RepID=UPI0034525E2E